MIFDFAIPGFGTFRNQDVLPGFNPGLTNTGSLISAFLNIVFMTAAFLSFFWFAWGAFEYIFAGGEKERLGKAKKRLTWAIIGLIIVMLSFAFSQFIRSLFPFLLNAPENRAIIEQETSVPIPEEVR